MTDPETWSNDPAFPQTSLWGGASGVSSYGRTSPPALSPPLPPTLTHTHPKTLSLSTFFFSSSPNKINKYVNKTTKLLHTPPLLHLSPADQRWRQKLFDRPREGAI